MLLSICIPTFNRLPYLKEAIDALLPQIEKTMPGQVEFLVSDNCSTDGTADYLAAMQSNRLRFWTNEVNIGGDRNFLKCISEARGDYVWLVGDDDLVAHDGKGVAESHGNILGTVPCKPADPRVGGSAADETRHEIARHRLRQG